MGYNKTNTKLARRIIKEKGNFSNKNRVTSLMAKKFSKLLETDI